MKAGWVLLVFALAVLLGGALVAPWLYWGTRWAGDHFPAWHGLTQYPFHRYVSRCLMGLGLIGIWPLMRALKARSWRDLGWIAPRGQWPRLGWGFALGFISLAAVIALALLAGAREPKPELQASRMVGKLLSAALSALVVGFMEETFFRGAILGSLRRAGSAGFALVTSSAIYALVHFFQRSASPESVHWYSGLIVLADMCRGFLEWRTLVPGFFTLMLVGLILGLAFQRTGSLYFSFGLHAGWVFWLKFSTYATALPAGVNTWLWGSPKLVDGWLAMAAMAAVLAMVALAMRSNRSSDNARLFDQADKEVG